MAVKDHSLDDKIIRAAEAEFLEHGFVAASMHKIAERAGVTTGALYTRYKNKDALFGSPVSYTHLHQMRPQRRGQGGVSRLGGGGHERGPGGSGRAGVSY